MTMTIHHLIALLPLAIVGLTLVVVMLAIAWQRHHLLCAALAMLGLNLALLSLFLVAREGPLQVTPLLMVDGYAIFYMALVLVASLASVTFAYPWLQGYPDNREEFYLLMLVATTGGLVLACTRHLAALFIGIELMSLPLYGLIGYAYRQHHSLEAGIKYMILSASASAFLLFGMALLYTDSGSLAFEALGTSLAQGGMQQPLILAGMGMMLVGFGFKLSLVPFHLWTPDVYEGAPAPVATFVATANKVAIFAVLLRFFLTVPAAALAPVHQVLSLLALLSILFGNLLALRQTNLKRLLGYSSIAHFGYLLVAVLASQLHQLPQEAVGVYLLGYLFTSLGAFGVVSLLSSPYRGRDADSLYSYRGLFWHRPVITAALTLTMLALAGIPTTLGFIGKFYILMVGVEAHYWWLTGAVVLGSALGLYYYLRVMVTLYLREPGALRRDMPRRWALSAGGLVVLGSALAVLVLGLYPQPLLALVQLAQELPGP